MTIADTLKQVTTRKMLVASSLAVIGSMVGAIVLSSDARSGSAAVEWAGVLSIFMAGATICAVVVSFVHASRHDRSGMLWAVGSLLFPYAAPLVLAALPVTGGVSVSAAEDAAVLHSVLVGKWICSCGVIRSDAHDGDVCDDCGKPMLRFHPAEPGQVCSSCGFRFSDTVVTTEDTMQEVWARKGFRCNRCGERICMSCLPTDADGELDFHCRCGGSVAIRV